MVAKTTQSGGNMKDENNGKHKLLLVSLYTLQKELPKTLETNDFSHEERLLILELQGAVDKLLERLTKAVDNV